MDKKISYQPIHRIICLSVLCLIIGSAYSAKAVDDPAIYLPLIMNNFTHGPGNLTGKVIDASSMKNGSTWIPLIGAVVCLDSSTCDKTDENGDYAFFDLPSGGQWLSASIDGYHPETQITNVVPFQTITHNFALTPDFAKEDIEMRVVLTWDSTPSWPPENLPNDLDAHLWMDVLNVDTHIFPETIKDRGNCTIFPNACIETDYQRGFGPETVAIRKVEDAVYYYGVLNYNQNHPGVPAVAQTFARVQVFNKAGLVNTFDVPNGGEGNFWFVFSMDGNTREIVPANCIIPLPEEGQLPQCP